MLKLYFVIKSDTNFIKKLTSSKISALVILEVQKVKPHLKCQHDIPNITFKCNSIAEKTVKTLQNKKIKFSLLLFTEEELNSSHENREIYELVISYLSIQDE